MLTRLKVGLGAYRNAHVVAPLAPAREPCDNATLQCTSSWLAVVKGLQKPTVLVSRKVEIQDSLVNNNKEVVGPKWSLLNLQTVDVEADDACHLKRMHGVHGFSSKHWKAPEENNMLAMFRAHRSRLSQRLPMKLAPRQCICRGAAAVRAPGPPLSPVQNTCRWPVR